MIDWSEFMARLADFLRPAEQALRDGGYWIRWAGTEAGFTGQGTLEAAIVIFTTAIVFVVALLRRIGKPPHMPMSLDMATDFGAASVVVGLSTLVAITAFDQPPKYSSEFSILWSIVPASLGLWTMLSIRRKSKLVREIVYANGGLPVEQRRECLVFLIAAFLVFWIADHYAIHCLPDDKRDKIHVTSTLLSPSSGIDRRGVHAVC